MCTSSIMKPIVKITRALTGISKPKAPPVPKETEEAADMRKEMMAEEEEKSKKKSVKNDCKIKLDVEKEAAQVKDL